VANLGDGVCGPFRVFNVCDNGTVLLTTGSTGFCKASAFMCHVSNLARYLDKRFVRAALAAS
jgi:hypothetical protein